MLRFGVFLTLILLLVGSVSAAGISVSQTIGANEMAFEDTLTFEVTLTWDGPQSAYFFGQPLNPGFEKLKVGRFSSAISSAGSGDAEITTKRFEYQLIPILSGQAQISPVAIEYVSWPDSIPGKLSTEAMSIKVAEPRPKKIKEPVSWLWWAVVIVLLAGGGAVAVFRVRSKSQVEEKP